MRGPGSIAARPVFFKTDSIGRGLATSWLRLASAVAPAVVGFMVTAEGIAAVFLLFAAVSVIGGLAGVRMIETQNRRLEDIAQ